MPTYYQWKSKYGGMEAADLMRDKELEAGNARLNRLYTALALDNAAMKDLTAKDYRAGNQARGGAVPIEVEARPLRRSCECLGLSRAAYYRPPLDWIVRDAEVIATLARLVES